MKSLFKKNTNLILFVLALSANFLPGSVFASSVYIDSSRTDFSVGDTAIFSVRVDSENKNINAVEGSVLLDNLTESASLIDINTSGSALSLWPGKPLPSDDNTSISFAGGSPSGLNSRNAIIFNIVLKLEKEGQITLTPNNLSVYLNDGRGTKNTVSTKNLVINVLPNRSGSQSVDDWHDLISNDTTPPEPFEIYLGQEGSVFDGKKFLSFSTTDSQSGIDYYEVTEGDLSPVRSSGTYVLQEQNRSVKVTIVAYDSAGNARKSTYGSAPYNLYYLFIIAFVLVILVFVVYKRRRRKRY